jgi:hypothetical protein
MVSAQIVVRREEKCGAVPEVAYASVARSAQQPAHLARLVIVINGKVAKVLAAADSTTTTLRFEKGFVLVECDAVFLPDSEIAVTSNTSCGESVPGQSVAIEVLCP